MDTLRTTGQINAQQALNNHLKTLEIRTAFSCPFLVETMQKAGSIKVTLGEPSVTMAQLLLTRSRDPVLWIPSARDWLLQSEDQTLADLSLILKNHPQLTILIPFVHSRSGFGPWEWLSPDSESRQLQKLQSQIFSNTVWQDRFFSAEPLVTKMGLAQIYDPRWALSIQMPWSIEFQTKLGEELLQFLKLRERGPKKVIAVDFDNTLWPGLISEDEPALEAGTPVGEAFRQFQDYLLRLRDRGCYLVGLSRNDSSLIEEKFDLIPGMKLKKKDFAVIIANWERKSTNLLEAAGLLNLGAESFCFVDDDAAEIHRLRQDLPEVECLHLSADPAFRVAQLSNTSWFWTFQLTDEDLTRTKSQSLMTTRSRLLPETAQDLSALQVQIKLERATEKDLVRIHQLVTKTSQFNLTTQRWSLAEILQRMQSNLHQVWVYRVQDIYDDLGLIGALFFKDESLSKPRSQNLVLENWVMSCRAFSRRVEHQVWDQLQSQLKSHVSASWQFNGKNQIARERLLEIGFEFLSESRGATELQWTSTTSSTVLKQRQDA